MIALIPAWVWRWIALIGAVVAIVLAYNWWSGHVEQRGYDRADAAWQKREAKISADAEAKYASRLAKAVQRADALQDEVGRLSDLRVKEESDHAQNVEERVAAVRAGYERLRIRTSAPACPLPGGAAKAPAANSGGPSDSQDAEVLPEVAAEFVSIAGDTAKDVRDYNALLDYTVKMRAECMRAPEASPAPEP